MKKKSGKRILREEQKNKAIAEKEKEKISYAEKKEGLEKSIASDFEFTKDLIGEIDFLMD